MSRLLNAQVPGARVLAASIKNATDATEALLAYVPFTEDEVMKWEVATALRRLAGNSGDARPTLMQALKDNSPARRAIAVCERPLTLLSPI